MTPPPHIRRHQLGRGPRPRRVAAELIADLERVYARKKAANKELTELLPATGTGLMDPPGIGPSPSSCGGAASTASLHQSS
jgi:hypothetical protein